MLMKDIVEDVLLILRLFLEVPAVIIRDHPIGKGDLKIPVLQFVQVDLAYMQRTFRSFQHR